MTFVVFGQVGDNRRMSTYKIDNVQWQKLYAFLHSQPRAYAGQEEKCRRLVEAVHWILHTGAQWRELPEHFGKWNSVFKCLKARIPDKHTLMQKVAAWQTRRNASASTVNWRFTTADARIKLERLYPTIKDC